MLYAKQLVIQIIVDVVSVRLEGCYPRIIQKVLQDLSYTASIVIEENDGLCKLVHKTPDILLAALSHKVESAPGLIHISHRAFRQGLLLEGGEQTLKIAGSLVQLVGKRLTADLHELVGKAAHFTVQWGKM